MSEAWHTVPKRLSVLAGVEGQERNGTEQLLPGELKSEGLNSKEGEGASGMFAYVPPKAHALRLRSWVFPQLTLKTQGWEGPTAAPTPSLHLLLSSHPRPGTRRLAGQHVSLGLPHQLLGLPHVAHSVGRGRRGCPGTWVPPSSFSA